MQNASLSIAYSWRVCVLASRLNRWADRVELRGGDRFGSLGCSYVPAVDLTPDLDLGACFSLHMMTKLLMLVSHEQWSGLV